MTNTAFRTLLCVRFAYEGDLIPADVYRTRCICGSSLTVQHAVGCLKFEGANRSRRHNVTADTIASMIRATGGAAVQREVAYRTITTKAGAAGPRFGRQHGVDPAAQDEPRPPDDDGGGETSPEEDSDTEDDDGESSSGESARPTPAQPGTTDAPPRRMAQNVRPDISIRTGISNWELDLTIRTFTNKLNLTRPHLDKPRAVLDNSDIEKNNNYKSMVEHANENGQFFALSCTLTGVRSDSYNDFLRVLRRHYVDGATRNAAFPQTFTCKDYVSYIVQAATVTMLNESAKTLLATVNYACKTLPAFRLQPAAKKEALLFGGHPF
jgi:hypothetical protein